MHFRDLHGTSAQRISRIIKTQLLFYVTRKFDMGMCTSYYLPLNRSNRKTQIVLKKSCLATLRKMHVRDLHGTSAQKILRIIKTQLLFYVTRKFNMGMCTSYYLPLNRSNRKTQIDLKKNHFLQP